LIALACDKLRSKQHVAQQWRAASIDERFKIPFTYWSGTDPESLIENLHRIPSRFVMKPNHTSGRVLLADSALQEVPHTLIRELFAVWLRPDEETAVLGHVGYLGADRKIFVEERICTGDSAPVEHSHLHE